MKESQNRWIAVRLVYSLIMLYVICVTGMVTCFMLCDYSTLINWFSNQFPDAYRIDEYQSIYFTPDHYAAVQWIGPVLLLILFAFLVLLTLKKEKVNGLLMSLVEDCGFLFSQISRACTNLGFNERLMLVICFLFILAVRIFLFYKLPYQVDEAFNFVHFIHNGFLHTTLFTNNHVLYNLTSVVWWKLGADPMLSSRLTSILASLFLHLIIYTAVRQVLHFRGAVTVLLFCAVSFWTAIYSVEGYAYMLVALCWLTGTLSIVAFLHNKRGYNLFVLSSILGFYSSKLFLIPFFATVLFWIACNFQQNRFKQEIRRVSFAVFAVFIGASLLYLPQFLWSGASSAFYLKTQRHDLIVQMAGLFEIFSVMTDIHAKSYLAIAILLVLLAIAYKRSGETLKLLLIINLASLFSILLFIGIFRVYPPSRALVYGNILFSATVGIVISVYFPLKPGSLRNALVIFVLILSKTISSLYVYHNGWQKGIQGGLQDNNFYNRIKVLTETIVHEEPDLVYLDQRDLHLEPYLKLQAICAEKQIVLSFEEADKMKSDVLILNLPSSKAGAGFSAVSTDDQFGRIFVRR